MDFYGYTYLFIMLECFSVLLSEWYKTRTLILLFYYGGTKSNFPLIKANLKNHTGEEYFHISVNIFIEGYTHTTRNELHWIKDAHTVYCNIQNQTIYEYLILLRKYRFSLCIDNFLYYLALPVLLSIQIDCIK